MVSGLINVCYKANQLVEINLIYNRIFLNIPLFPIFSLTFLANHNSFVT